MKKKEFLEVVDEDNHSLGIKKEKLQAHLDGNWHRTTQIWVLNKKGEISVNQRSKTQYQDPNKWATFFGGHLLFGESYLQGALRETEEELGLRVEKKRLKKIELRKNPGPNEFVQILVLVLKNKEKPYFSREEFQQWRFVSPKELSEWARNQPEDFSGGAEYIEKQLRQLELFK